MNHLMSRHTGRPVEQRSSAIPTEIVDGSEEAKDYG